MAPKRGGEGGAGASLALTGGRGYFEPPPLKRMYPWQQDGAGQCDIIAGGVDKTGAFKGAYISGVHLMALLRTFQLAQPYLPVDMPTPVAALGQSLQDGIPIVVVTRGCFGREMDYGPGPVRNETKRAVWEMCRQMRAEMPHVLITCIDIPINCGTDVVQACLEEPLNDYHELMYHEGSWYTPTVISTASLAKWRAEQKDEGPVKSGGVTFNRKKFAWVDETPFYKDMWMLGWKLVLQVTPAPPVFRRTDLNFTEPPRAEVKPIQDAAPSAAEATLRKELAKGTDPGSIVKGIKEYLRRAYTSEVEGLKEAIGACSKAADLYKSQGDQEKACDAMGLAVEAYIYMNDVEKALEVATSLKTSAASPMVEAKAAKLIADCYTAQGDLNKAVEAAQQAKADIEKKGNAEATCEAVGLLVHAQLAKGDLEGAAASATAASKSSGDAVQAAGFSLLAEVQEAKAVQADDHAASTACWGEAVQARKAAAKIFGEKLGQRKRQAEALESAVSTLLTSGDEGAAAALARELAELPGDVASQNGTGWQLLAVAHLQALQKGAELKPGASEEMMSAASKAVAAFAILGDTVRRLGAQRVKYQAERAAGAAAV